MTTPTPLAESLERLESLHAEIMNLPCGNSPDAGHTAFKIGHKVARHAAAELVAERVGPLVDAVFPWNVKIVGQFWKLLSVLSIILPETRP